MEFLQNDAKSPIVIEYLNKTKAQVHDRSFREN